MRESRGGGLLVFPFRVSFIASRPECSGLQWVSARILRGWRAEATTNGSRHLAGFTLSVDPQLRLEGRSVTVTSDVRLLLPRELERLGLNTLMERPLADLRIGHNRQFPLRDLFRQPIDSRLAGYEDTNGAERLAEDPAFWRLASRERRETSVALTSKFETKWRRSSAGTRGPPIELGGP